MVIGAGPGSLAVATELTRRGARPVVLEAAARPGASWEGHYDSLRLNTARWLAHLPGPGCRAATGAGCPRRESPSTCAPTPPRAAFAVRTRTPAHRFDRDADQWVVASRGRNAHRSRGRRRRPGPCRLAWTPRGGDVTASPTSCCMGSHHALDQPTPGVRALSHRRESGSAPTRRMVSNAEGAAGASVRAAQSCFASLQSITSRAAWPGRAPPQRD